MPDAGRADIDPIAVRRAALGLLARREHLRAELAGKLLRRFPDRAAVEAVLRELAGQNLQSDLRFCESHARQRGGRGFGPLRIRQELRQRGAQPEHIEQALAACGFDWLELARAARGKRFGAELPRSPVEKSRQLRFLQYRGFAGDCASAALSPAAEP